LGVTSSVRRLQIERLVAGGDAMARDTDGRVVGIVFPDDPAYRELE